MSDFRLPVYGDSRAQTRFEPFVAPIHGNASGAAGGYRKPGIAPLFTLGGTNFGLAEQTRAATGVVRRADASAVSRLPVGQTRPVWGRFSLTGSQLDYGYGDPLGTGAPAGQPGPGSSSGCDGC